MPVNKRPNSYYLNYYRRVLEVQECFLEHQKPGMKVKFIYEEYIYPRFFISSTTFYKYLRTPAARELKKIEAELKEQ